MLKYIIFILLVLPIVYSQDYMKIKYFYVPKDMVVESTKSNESIVIVENTHNETIYMVSLKYNLPSGFSISQKEIEELQSNQKKSIKFNLTANTNKGVYNITIWAESIDDISGNKIQSPKYTFQVSVLEKTGVNTTIATTTYSIITTTTYSTTANTTTVATQSTTTNVQIKRLTNNVKFVLIGAIILILVVLLIIMSR
jgi:uncharacterized integral membrane protein